MKVSNFQKSLLCLVAFILVGCFLVLLQYEYKKNSNFKITQYKIETPKDIKNLRILLITDLHLAEYGEDNEKLLAEIENLNPDIIAVAGDVVIHREMDFSSAIFFLNRASEIAPTYFSTGNHEWSAINYHKNYELSTALEECGAIWLDNKKETIIVDGKELLICGIYDSPRAEHGYSDIILPEFNAEPNDKFKLLLSHCPLTISNTKTTPEADLVLSGHEHGGQIIIPLINRGLYSKNQGLFPKHSNGINLIANNVVIISTGLSNSYYAIPRINNQPELVVIDVN